MGVAGATAIVGAYLLGGIPVGLLVGRTKGIPDIRKLGSGNIGASNVLRILGVRAGLLVWVADCLKGLAPVLVARHALGMEGWWLAGVGVAATAGHCFSPYLRLSGGRGVSTGLGVLLGAFWPVGVCALAVFIIVVAKTRYISLGSILGAASAPVWMMAWGRWIPDHAPYVAMGGVVAALVVIRHVPNIRRLCAGTERKLGQREVATGASAEDGRHG